MSFITNNFISQKTSQQKKEQETNSATWTTEKIDDIMDKIEFGEPYNGPSPFFQGNTEWRAPNITFELSPEEFEEYKKCARDVLHFANNYAYSMTDEGVQKIVLRDYQIEILDNFKKNRQNMLMVGRQSGKTITSAIYIAWYACFHVDRNILITANKGATAKEIVSKVFTVIDNLPFFLKPGIKGRTASSCRFDNGCQMQAKSTTFSTGRGDTTHLLYADEFAFIPSNIIDRFFDSIYPSLSSSKISQFIITSTPPPVFNKFCDLWDKAITKQNSFNAIKIPWDKIPGRDEAWKEKTIEDVGMETFLREYSCEFVFGSNVLIPSVILDKQKRNAKPYKWKPLEHLDSAGIKYDELTWHKDFEPYELDGSKHKIVIGVDLSGNLNKDYSVFNIFQLGAMSPASIRNKKVFDSTKDFFLLRQVGIYRTNTSDAVVNGALLRILVFDILGPNNVSVVVESNFGSDFLLQEMAKHKEYTSEIFVKTKHSIDSLTRKIGVRYTSSNKSQYLELLKKHFGEKRFILSHPETINEFYKYGMNQNGKYASQGSNDDCVMSALTASIFFQSDELDYFVSEIYDNQTFYQKNEITKKLLGIESQEDLESEFSLYEKFSEL